MKPGGMRASTGPQTLEQPETLEHWERYILQLDGDDAGLELHE
jgi:hypothetical protein